MDWAFPALVLLAAFFIVWYIVGNEVMRRRARQLALWSKRSLDPLGGRQSVLWTTMQSFRLDVEEAKEPFRSAQLTGLVESWDTPAIWFWNRMRGRRDMVLLQLHMRRQPALGLELYRPGTLVSVDSNRLAADEGWNVEQLGEFQLATPAPRGRELAIALLELLDAQRSNLLRIGVRRREPHLTIALNVPERTRLEPLGFADLLRALGRHLAG